MANMNAKLVAGLMLVAVLANGAAAKQYTCEEMADRLNEKWMVGSNRFDAGGKTGQEAREALGEWIDSNGILTTRCTPSGYPDVEGPCTDGFIMDHVAASWVGLTDRAKELVESDKLQPFPAFPVPGIGLIFDASKPEAGILCSYPSDASTDARQPDEEGNKGCGPRENDYYFGNKSRRPVIEQYLKDKQNNQANVTNEMQVRNFVREYNDSASTWSLKDWETTGRTWENFTCGEWAGMSQDWTAFTPKDTSSMEACKAYIKDPSNVWDEEKTHFGSFLYWQLEGMSTWDDPLEAVLGHPSCKDTSNKCNSNGSCTVMPIEWVGACSWPPESFASAMDTWLELRSRANPMQAQMNEISLDLEANGPGVVEALYVSNTPYGAIGNDKLIAEFIKQTPPDQTPLKNVTEYFSYAAKKLAEDYYGGIPVVLVNATKENALAGTMFSCDFE